MFWFLNTWIWIGPFIGTQPVDKQFKLKYNMHQQSSIIVISISYLAITNNSNDTPKYAPNIHPQTSLLKGERNENRLGGAFEGFLCKILIPKHHEEIIPPGTRYISKLEIYM